MVIIKEFSDTCMLISLYLVYIYIYISSTGKDQINLLLQ